MSKHSPDTSAAKAKNAPGNKNASRSQNVSCSLPSADRPVIGADEARTRALDPLDWDAFRAAAHKALDDMISNLAGVGDRPVWREVPPDIAAKFEAPLPRGPRDLSDVVADVSRDIAPFVTGNRHPLFMGWVHGAGTPTGMVAEMLSAGLNANCGGRNHVGLNVERQITRWAATLFNYPATEASGLFVNGTSMANFLALLIARQKLVGARIRKEGLAWHGNGGPDAESAQGPMTVYTSVQAHGCIAQALDLSGLGTNALRAIGVDENGRIKTAELRAKIEADLAHGCRAMMLVGTAGSVNIGAIDPLHELADIAHEFGLWFHIDGAFGALAALSARLKPLLAGIERSHSIAFDFHKWAHVPYDAGFLLVRDGAAHRATFSDENAYLQRAPRGLAKGEVWPCDLGPDLSRGFRALKTWMTFQNLGADAIAGAIENCCAVAQLLAQKIERSNAYDLAAPVALNIVCFRLRTDGGGHSGGDADGECGGGDDQSNTLGDANKKIVMDLHASGLAAPSLTTLNGAPAIRCAIVNHRTAPEHIESFMTELERLAAAH